MRSAAVDFLKRRGVPFVEDNEGNLVDPLSHPSMQQGFVEGALSAFDQVRSQL